MSNPDDPLRQRPFRRSFDPNGPGPMWLGAAAAALVVAAAIAWGFGGTSKTAKAPAVTTTGSGAVTTGTERPSQPAQPLPNPRAPGAPAQR
jgi:hypothetical protein